MAKTKISATDEAGSTPIVVNRAKSKSTPREYLNHARRALTEDELTSTGAIRLLISESDRLEDRCIQLEEVEKKYHDLRVANAALEARLKLSTWHEILSGLCLAIGSFGIAQGARLMNADMSHDIGVTIVVVSSALIVAGILSKVWK
ncbi:hypothetical protein [Afipia felis]|uniref:hypothetical protein n=1 Tax=Afipia felis TaxID=1035 RepID=UPI0011C0300E|nr:hypothetical protein [Afipia felis]